MARRFVDDGGNNTTGLDWNTAYTSINALITAEASFLTTSGNEVVFGADMQCQAVNSASLSITGPTGGSPLVFSSSTVYPGTSTVSYTRGTGNQIDTSEGAYNVTFNGAFKLIGLKIKSGGRIYLEGDPTECFIADEATFLLGAGSMLVGGVYGHGIWLRNCKIDLAADSSAQSGAAIQNSSVSTQAGMWFIQNLEWANTSYRDTYLIDPGDGYMEISGGDWSGLPNITWFSTRGRVVCTNVKANWTSPPAIQATQNRQDCLIQFSNVGSSHREYWFHQNSLTNQVHYCETDTSHYRSGGASYAGTPCSWKMTGTGGITFPQAGPWMYGSISSTGSKTITAYIAQEGGSALLNDEIWLEVEYLGTSGMPHWSLADDSVADCFATPAAQTTDGSTWTGFSSATKQRLEVTVTVNQTGRFRARVMRATSATVYVDPKPVVS